MYFVITICYLFCKIFWRYTNINKKANNRDCFKDLFKITRKNRIANEILAYSTPTFYPNGWIGILASQQLAINEVKSIFALSKQLFAFRDKSGKVHVAENLCKHLFPNQMLRKVLNELGDDCIECSHKCVFRVRDGVVQSPKEGDSMHDNKHLKVWEVIEINHFIFIWHHAENKISKWFPLKIEDKMQFHNTRRCYLSVHSQDIMENPFDMAHLKAVHKPILGFSNTRISQYLLKYIHYDNVGKNTVDKNGYTSYMDIKMSAIFFGLKLFRFQMHLTVNAPANLETEFTLFNTKFYVSSIFIPMHETNIKALHIFGAENNKILSRTISWLLAYILHDITLAQDYEVWNNKKHIKYPMPTKNENKLHEFRKYFKQFYCSTNV